MTERRILASDALLDHARFFQVAPSPGRPPSVCAKASRGAMRAAIEMLVERASAMGASSSEEWAPPYPLGEFSALRSEAVVPELDGDPSVRRVAAVQPRPSRPVRDLRLTVRTRGDDPPRVIGVSAWWKPHPGSHQLDPVEYVYWDSGADLAAPERGARLVWRFQRLGRECVVVAIESVRGWDAAIRWIAPAGTVVDVPPGGLQALSIARDGRRGAALSRHPGSDRIELHELAVVQLHAISSGTPQVAFDHLAPRLPGAATFAQAGPPHSRLP